MRTLALFVCLFVCLAAETNKAAESTLAAPGDLVDANLVTGLDVSSSIDPAELALQLEGMAAAVQSPEVLAAISHGRHGRIGFAVFLWSDGGFPLCGAWRLIGSAEDAAAAGEELRARCPAMVAEAGAGGQSLTNLSAALDEGGRLIATAPFASARDVVNIVGNGEDNVGSDALEARDRLVAAGVAVNGVVVGADPAVLAYYRAEVIAGGGRVAIGAKDASDLGRAMRLKFKLEISQVTP